MTFSLFHVSYVPVYTASNANLAWIVQDYLQANGIEASIEVHPCEPGDADCDARPSFSVCVSGDKADKAKALASECEAVKIAGFLSPSSSTDA